MEVARVRALLASCCTLHPGRLPHWLSHHDGTKAQTRSLNKLTDLDFFKIPITIAISLSCRTSGAWLFRFPTTTNHQHNLVLDLPSLQHLGLESPLHGVTFEHPKTLLRLEEEDCCESRTSAKGVYTVCTAMNFQVLTYVETFFSGVRSNQRNNCNLSAKFF